jgi:hypothetical protein
MPNHSTFRFAAFAGLFAALLAAAMSIRVEAQAGTAALLGTVTDSSGGAVAEAVIRATHTGTGVTQIAVTDSQGRFRVPNLAVGRYEVQSEKNGFQTVIHKDIDVTVGSERVVDFALPVGNLTETVTVEQSIPLVDTITAQISNLVDETQIRELPLNGRNIEQLILLAPGVQIYQNIVAGAFYGAAPAYSVSGSRPNGQAQVLDGTNVQDYFNRGSGAGVLGTSMGVEAIGEFQLLTNTYSAQYGGNGSVMNAVTKSGTNAVHGSAYEFLRHSRMDARNFFDRPGEPIPPFRRNQFGLTLGGPIKRDRVFFFANYEGLRQTLGLTRIITVPDENARNGFLPTGPGGSLVNVGVDPRVAPYFKFWPLPDRPIGGGLGNVTMNPSQEGDENYFLGRLDWTLPRGASLFVRYISDKAELLDPAAGPLPELNPAINSNHNQFATVEARIVPSNRAVNLVRFSMSRPQQESRTDIAIHPELQWFPGEGLPDGGLTIAGGITGLGSAAPGPWEFLQSRYTIADDLFLTRGGHNLKFGASATAVHSDVFSPIPGHGSFSFNSLTLFLQGVPQQYSGTVPGGRDATRLFREMQYDVYAQDDWRLSREVTLNLGLRYSPTNNGTEADDKLHRIINPPFGPGFEHVDHIYEKNPSLRNIDPRLGVAWDPFDDHSTSIRAGFGVFHAVIGPRDYAATYYNSPPFRTAVQQNPVFSLPFTFSNILAALPTQTFAMDMKNDLATPYVVQWNVSVQHEIAPTVVGTAAYVGSRSENQVQQIQLNPPIPTTLPDGRLQFATLQMVAGRPAVVDNPRVNPAFDNLSSSRTIGWARYHGLQLGVNRRFAANWSGQVSYTYSTCTDIGSGSFLVDGGTTASNPFDPDADEGRCTYDIRHNMTANGLYTLPFSGNALVEGWQISGIVSAHSGNPFNVSTGIATHTFRGSAARPDLVPGCDPLRDSTVNRWFDPACFTLPPVGVLGDFGRNVLNGPKYLNVDAALLKTVALPSGRSIQLRGEVFNVLNRANFGAPSGAVFSQGAVAGTGVINPNVGRITSTRTTSRQVQLAVKFMF